VRIMFNAGPSQPHSDDCCTSVMREFDTCTKYEKLCRPMACCKYAPKLQRACVALNELDDLRTMILN